MRRALPSPDRRGLAAAGLLVGLTLAAYLPVWQAGIVWNDPDYITRPALRSLAGLGRIWTRLGATEQYYPLLHSAFWVEHRLWGNAALGYHLLNVALHSANAVLFWRILRTLFARAQFAGKENRAAEQAPAPWAGDAAWLGAALFALHPVMVESVAWISEQKNTLSLVFYLLAAREYFRFTWQDRRAAYWLGLGCFLCALLCKTVTATLPAALLVVLWWVGEPLRPSRQSSARINHWLRLAPWLVLAAGSGLFSGWVEKTYVGASGDAFSLSFLQRLLLAARAPWFYLGKLLWPARLVFIYPHWDVIPRQPLWWAFLFATAAATAAGIAFARRRRGPLALWLLFLGGLFPTIGFLNVYAFVYSYVADHWNYLSALPVFAGGGWLLAEALGRWRPIWRAAAAAILLGILGLRTWEECLPFHDAMRFYATIVERNPGAWLAENNLAKILVDERRFAEALPYLNASLKAWPDAPIGLLNRGVALRWLGRDDESIADLKRALELEPDFALARSELAKSENDAGAAALSAGDLKRAGQLLTAAIRLDPNLAIAWANIGRILISAHRPVPALQALEEALRLQPDFPEAQNDLGAAFVLLGRPADAIPHYEAALRLRPDFPDAERNLAAARQAAAAH